MSPTAVFADVTWLHSVGQVVELGSPMKDEPETGKLMMTRWIGHRTSQDPTRPWATRDEAYGIDVAEGLAADSNQNQA